MGMPHNPTATSTYSRAGVTLLGTCLVPLHEHYRWHTAWPDLVEDDNIQKGDEVDCSSSCIEVLGRAAVPLHILNLQHCRQHHQARISSADTQTLNATCKTINKVLSTTAALQSFLTSSRAGVVCPSLPVSDSEGLAESGKAGSADEPCRGSWSGLLPVPGLPEGEGTEEAPSNLPVSRAPASQRGRVTLRESPQL